MADNAALTPALTESPPPAVAAAAAGALPSVESILGPPPSGGLPSVQDILGPEPTEADQTTSAVQTGVRMAMMPLAPVASIFMGYGVGAPAATTPTTAPTGPEFENFLSHTAVGRVLSQFGQGVEQGWGSGNLGMSPELDASLKKSGILPDVQKGQGGILRAFNEGLIRPAAAALDATIRGVSAVAGGITGLVGGIGTEVGGKQFGRELGTLTQATMADLGSRIPAHAPIEPLPRTPVDLPAARDLGVIGADGDGPYMGTAPRGSVPDTAALRDVVQEQQATAPPPGEAATPAPVEGVPIAEPPATPMDVHAVARSIAPETFTEYDALVAHQAELRTSLANSVDTLRQQAEAQAPGAAEIADLQARMQDTTPRLAKKYAARLADLQPAHDAFLNDEFTMAALSRDTPEVAAIRQQLLETDFRMRDLAPDVTNAYREAAKQFPEAVAEAEPVAAAPVAEPAPTEAPQPVPEATPPVTQEAAAEAAPKAPEPPLVVPQSIAADVSGKLQAAGRPSEEADAAGQVSEAMWRTRAQAFGGSKGTPEEMYAREAPEIRGQRQGAREREMAQKGRVLEQKGRHLQTETPEFKRWFGESKVVGEDGKPLVVYRGEEAGFSKLGSWFTSDKDTASAYSERLDGSFGYGANVTPVYLSMSRPLVVDAAGSRYDSITFNGKAVTTEELTEIAKDEGHDGLVIKNVVDGSSHKIDVFHPFDRTRVKSAIGNRGAFDPTDANILHQGAQGKIRLTEDGRAVITLMRTANASTFLHETGHDWLERMMRDAVDPDAPQAMRDDAAAVRKYLGVEEGADLTTKAHEKFARSFERYFMEGRAPTAALGRVFAKFKDWLTAIYQTVAKLRAPITADIRDVFDRLLSTEAERSAIVSDEGESVSAHVEPQNPSGASVPVTAHLADLHEADLRDATPEDAADVAQHVRTEIDKTVDEHAPEVADEFRGGQAEGGTGRDAASAGDTGANGSEAGTDTGSTRGAEQPDAIDASGSGAATDGDSASGRPNPWAGNATKQPAGPNEPFAPAESGLIDKAGNIRLDNLDTPEDVNQVIRDAAAQNEDFIGARRGVVSDADVIDLADALGMRPADLDRRKLGEAFNAEQVMAARKLLVQSATAVRDAMAKAVDGSDADVMAFAEARERHLMIQSQVAGITAEAGRALRAFRDLGGGVKDARLLGDILQNLTGKTLFQMRRAAKAGMELDTPEQVSKFLADSEKPDFWDKLVEYWINCLISGPATHTTYSVGNALLMLWRAVPETAAAAAMGTVREALGGTGPRVYWGEVGAGLHAIVFGQREGFIAAWKAAKTGLTTELPGESETGAQGSFLSMQQTPRGAIPGVAGEVIRGPTRGVAVIHSYFRTVNYEAEIARLAYRQAASEGLNGNAFAARVADLTTNPSEVMMASARDVATNATLMGRGGELTQKIAELSNTRVFGAPLPKFVMPFVRIGSNVMVEGLLERSPFGVLDAGIRDNMMGRNGAVARDAQVARIAVGSALGATAIGLAAQGYLTGSGPSDPKAAAVWRMAGNQPYSVRIGETWYAMHRLGPLAMIMGIAADMHEFGAKAGDKDIGTIATMLTGSIAKNLLDESWMRGPSGLMQAVQDPARYGARFVRDELSSFVPFSVGMAQITRGMDPFARQARTLMDAVINKIPGLSETLLPRRDIWGAPIENLPALGGRAVSALTESVMTHDPATQALLRLNVFPGAVRRDVLGVPLTDQQYDSLQVTAGHLAHMMVSQIVSQPGFSVLPQGVQQRLVNETITKARGSAATLLKMQHPEIIRQAVANKQQLLTVGKQPKP